jgi:hypothetical protein
MSNKKLLVLLLAFFVFGKNSAQKKFIPFNSPNISYEGRIDFKNNAATLYWSGSNINLNFKGSEISAILKDADTANYYNVIIDDKVVSKIQLDTLKKTYLLASGLSNENHKIQLFKRTEWDKGTTYFYGFETNENTKLLPKSKPKKRKIEFFGNSITCGYAIEDYSINDSRSGHFENNYLTYAALTARHFDAQYHCTSRSGIGITISWHPEIMPEIYDLINPNDEKSKWDFNKYTPDIVVVNLLQNDSYLVKFSNHEQFKKRFGTVAPTKDFIIDAYEKFIKSIRLKYPKAHIICALGSMDITKEGSIWPSYVTKAVNNLNDKKIYTHFFKFKNSDGHPKIEEQKQMADSLITFIDQTIKW